MRRKVVIILMLFTFVLLLTSTSQASAFEISNAANTKYFASYATGIKDDFNYDSITAGFWTRTVVGSDMTYSIDNSILFLNSTVDIGHLGVWKNQKISRKITSSSEIHFEILLNRTYIRNYNSYFQITFRDSSGYAWFWLFINEYDNVKMFYRDIATMNQHGQVIYTNSYINGHWLKFVIEIKDGIFKVEMYALNGTKLAEGTQETLGQTKAINQISKILIESFVKGLSGINYNYIYIDYVKTQFSTVISTSGDTADFQLVSTDSIVAKSTGGTASYEVHATLLFENLLSFSAVGFADLATSAGYDEMGFAVYGFDGSTWNQLVYCSLGYDGAVNFYWGSGGSYTFYENKGFGVQLWLGKDGYWHFEYVADDDGDGLYTVVADDSDMVLTNMQYYAYKIDVFAILDSLNGQTLKVQYQLKTGTGYVEKPNYFKYESSQPSYQAPSAPTQTEEPSLGSGLDWVTGGITWLWNMIYGILIFIYESIVSTILALPGLIWGFFEGILNDLYDTAVDTFNKLSALYDYISTTIYNVLTDIYNRATDIYNYLQNYIYTVLSDIYTTATDIYTKLSDLYDYVTTTIYGVLSDTYNKITDTYNWLTSTLYNLVNDIYASVQNVYNKIVDTYNYITGTLYDLIDTIYNTLNNLYNWITVVANYMWIWIVYLQANGGEIMSMFFNTVLWLIDFMINFLLPYMWVGLQLMAVGLLVYIIEPVVFEDGDITDMTERAMTVARFIIEILNFIWSVIQSVMSGLGGALAAI